AKSNGSMLAGLAGNRGHAALGRQLLCRREAATLIAELSEHLRSAEASATKDGRNELPVGVRLDGVLDGRGEIQDLGNQRAQHRDQRSHAVALGVSLELAGSAAWRGTKALEQLDHGAPARVAVPCQERRQTLHTERGRCARRWVTLEEVERDWRV